MHFQAKLKSDSQSSARSLGLGTETLRLPSLYSIYYLYVYLYSRRPWREHADRAKKATVLFPYRIEPCGRGFRFLFAPKTCLHS